MGKKKDVGPLPDGFAGDGSEADMKLLVEHARILHYDRQRFKDELKGANRDIAGWRTRYANLERDREKDARQSALWPVAERVFKVWLRAAGKDPRRTRFTFDRFDLVRRFLKDAEEDEIGTAPGPPSNPLEECMAAVIGGCFDCFVTVRANGSTKHHNDLKLIFRDQEKFEESRDRRPRDWRARVAEYDPYKPEQPDALPGLEDAA